MIINVQSTFMQSTISMRSMLMVGGLGAYAPRKILKTDPLRLNLRVFQGHSHQGQI